MPNVRIIPNYEPIEQDWKKIFEENLDAFPKGVELRASATLPCGRTLPPLVPPPTDAFGHWEKTAPWRWPNRKKVERSQSNFPRRYWEAETLVRGAIETGNPEFVFDENQCDQHPITVAWWWAIHGCEKCKKTHARQLKHFEKKIAKKDRERFPGFALQNPALIDQSTHDLNPAEHPLLKPATPLQESSGRKRSRTSEAAREKRHLHIVDKYPYNVARKGTDTNPSNWTFQALSTKQDQMDLGRKWTKPQVPWH